MQWEEKCRFAVSLIGLKVIAVFVVISMTFEGLSVTALAQDEIFSEGSFINDGEVKLDKQDENQIKTFQ